MLNYMSAERSASRNRSLKIIIHKFERKDTIDKKRRGLESKLWKITLRNS